MRTIQFIVICSLPVVGCNVDTSVPYADEVPLQMAQDASVVVEPPATVETPTDVPETVSDASTVADNHLVVHIPNHGPIDPAILGNILKFDAGADAEDHCADLSLKCDGDHIKWCWKDIWHLFGIPCVGCEQINYNTFYCENWPPHIHLDGGE